MSNSKLLIELVNELNLDVDEATLNTMYKILDAGMDPENLIEILEKIKQEMEN